MRDNRKAGKRARLHQPAGEAFILLAMSLVSVALGLGLYLQFGWTLWNAAVTTTAVYIAFASAHALRRRSDAIKALGSEIERLEAEMHRMAGAAPIPDNRPQGPAPSRPHGFAGSDSRAAGQATAGRARGAPPASRPSIGPQRPAAVPPVQPPTPVPMRDGPEHRSVSAPRIPDMAPSRQAADPALPVAGNKPAMSPAPAAPDPGGTASAAPAGPTADARSPAPKSQSPLARFWAFRPAEPQDRAPEFQRALAEDTEPTAGKQPMTAASPAAPIDPDQEVGAVAGDVDIINGMIRRFAEEFHPLEHGNVPRTVPEPVESQAHLQPEALSASVDALKAAANQMRRQAEAAAPSTAIERGVLPPLRPEAARGHPPPPVGPAHAQMAAIAEAVERQRFDVYLAPLVGLTDRRVRHYELTLRLAAELQGGDLAAVARGTGLLPIVDRIRVTRAAAVGRYMDERSSGGSLFVALSSESLAADLFLRDFSETCARTPRLRERLVLCIAQPEVTGLSPAQWKALKDLGAAGIRFAICDVATLDLNLPELKSAGFAFFRVHAKLLLDGLPSLEGILPAADVCRRLGGTGLALIADGIETEDQLGRVLQAGAPVGQGPFFGVPRPVKPQALQQARSAAA